MVVVAVAGLTGCETVLCLLLQGKKVILVDMLPECRIAADAPFINRLALRGIMEANGVAIRSGVKLEAVTAAGVVVSDQAWKRTEIACDHVVLALGLKPRTETVAVLAGLAPEVYVAGDCARERGGLWRATTDGFHAAMEI
jgi:pyruvate/2-oxoglutarate dehydrogenase complex dihydrolipoamide dehydrogenase (E3) component